MGELIEYEDVLLRRLLQTLPIERALAHLVDRTPRILGTPPFDRDAWLIQSAIVRSQHRELKPAMGEWLRDNQEAK